MNVSKLIGAVSRDPPSGVELDGQKLLLRSGNFVWTTSEVVVLPGGSRILNSLVSHFTQTLGADQQVQFHNSFPEFLYSQFSSYRSLPQRFHQIIQGHSEWHPPLGMISPGSQPVLEICLLQEEVPRDLLLSSFPPLKITEVSLAEGLGREVVFTPLHEGHEHMVSCTNCGYAGLRSAARFRRKEVHEELAEMQEIATPGCKTIDEVASFVGTVPSKTAKAIFHIAEISGEEKLVFSVIRGDLELNEDALAFAIGADSLRAATPEEIERTGAVPGYASPIGVDHDLCTVVVDPSIQHTPNLVAGANREGYHILNCNFPRDFEADIVEEIALVEEGMPCVNCGEPLVISRGVVLAEMRGGTGEAEFTSSSGKPTPISWQRIHFYLFSILGVIAENSHDRYGVIFPPAISPWRCIVIPIHKGDAGERLLQSLLESLDGHGVPYLLDDRRGKVGQKFMEADLRGIPTRIVVSDKNQGLLEIKDRHTGETNLIELSRLLEVLQG